MCYAPDPPPKKNLGSTTKKTKKGKRQGSRGSSSAVYRFKRRATQCGVCHSAPPPPLLCTPPRPPPVASLFPHPSQGSKKNKRYLPHVVSTEENIECFTTKRVNISHQHTTKHQKKCPLFHLSSSANDQTPIIMATKEQPTANSHTDQDNNTKKNALSARLAFPLSRSHKPFGKRACQPPHIVHNCTQKNSSKNYCMYQQRQQDQQLQQRNGYWPPPPPSAAVSRSSSARLPACSPSLVSHRLNVLSTMLCCLPGSSTPVHSPFTHTP